MKCINRFCRIRFSCIAALLCVFLLTGCGNISYTFPYNVNSNVSSFNVLAGTGTGKADAFASDLCVVTGHHGTMTIKKSGRSRPLSQYLTLTLRTHSIPYKYAKRKGFSAKSTRKIGRKAEKNALRTLFSAS